MGSSLLFDLGDIELCISKSTFVLMHTVIEPAGRHHRRTVMHRRKDDQPWIRIFRKVKQRIMISFCKHSPDDNRSHFRQQAVPWTSICIYAWYLIWETSLDMENQTNLWMRVWEINLCTWPIRFWQIHKYSVYDRPIWASESNVYETNLYIYGRDGFEY